MGRGPSMLLREDLLEIVIRTQAVLRHAPVEPGHDTRALDQIAEVYREKGLLDPPRDAGIKRAA